MALDVSTLVDYVIENTDLLVSKSLFLGKTVDLINAEGAYCNATTDPVVCSRCLAKFDAWKDIDIVCWRDRSAAFLRGARYVFAPSQWAADTLAKYFPGVDVTIAPPWPEGRERAFSGAVTNGFDLPNDMCRHIGVLGAIGPEKGARHVEALARRIRERNLPLRIVVVGYLDREHRGQSQDKVLTIHGPYAGAEVGALLDLYFALTSQSGTWSIDEIAGWQREAGLSVMRPIHLRTVPGAAEVIGAKPGGLGASNDGGRG